MPRHGRSWKRKLVVASLIAGFLASPLVSAELKFFPHWQRMLCGDQEFACYNFEQAQLILTVDLDFQIRTKALENCVADVGDLRKVKVKLETSLRLLEENQGRFETALDRKNKMLEKNLTHTQELLQRDVFGNALPWIIAIVVVVAGGMFTVGYVVGN